MNDATRQNQKVIFRDSICAHLSAYKRDVLRIAEDGKFRYRGKNIAKAHVLPVEHHKLNILPGYRERSFSSKHLEIHFHQFFHHLNSSQALCINLFFPLLAEEKAEAVTRYLDVGPVANLKPRFEKESDIEQPMNWEGRKFRRTNFDFYIRHCNGELFFEIKYTEAGFGKAIADAEHKEKFQKIYLPLIEKSVFLTDRCRDESNFLGHYQILRNLVHLSPDSRVVFLFPSANATIKQEAVAACQQLLTDEGRVRVRIVFLEEVVSFLEREFHAGPLAAYYSSFREKYIPRTIP